MAKFNLDNIMSKTVHRPISRKDSEMRPLYVRSDLNYVTDGNSNDEDYVRTKAWIEASKSHYSSPNNIRRIFITYNGVIEHLYRPYVGDKNKLTERFFKYADINTEYNPVEILKTISSQRSLQSLRGITKSGLGFLNKEWSCSNLEEVYFDWTLLLCEEALDCLGENKIYRAINNKDNKVNNLLFDYIKNKLLPDMTNTSLKDIYPRLKYVGYIQDLFKLESVVKRKTGEETAESLSEAWCMSQSVKNHIFSGTSLFSIYQIPNVPKYNTRFSTRSYYKFDSEILQAYFDRLEAKILKERQSEEGNSSLDINALEAILKRTEKNHNLEMAQDVLIIMLQSSGEEQRKEIINSLTPELRARYIRKQ